MVTIQLVRRGLGLLGLAAVLEACGTPPVDGAYPGMPGFTLTGTATKLVADQAYVSPTIAVFWVQFTGQNMAYADPSPMVVKGLTAQFELSVFDPPAAVASAFANSTGGVDAEIAFGFLFAFDDVDQNGAIELDPDGYHITPDVFIGLANTAVIDVITAPAADSEFATDRNYVSSTYDGALFTSAEMLTPGYHLVHEVCGSDGQTNKSWFQVVSNTTQVDLRLFPPTDTTRKEPDPPLCLIVL